MDIFSNHVQVHSIEIEQLLLSLRPQQHIPTPRATQRVLVVDVVVESATSTVSLATPL
jgi:hypothetical protein